MRRTIQALLWDNDGVLVRTEAIHFHATQAAFASAGLPLSKEQYVELYLVQGRSAWQLAIARGMSDDDISRLKGVRDAIYEHHLRDTSLALRGVKAVLDALRSTYRMAIVTGSRRKHLELVHQATGLQDYFDFAVTLDDCVNTKPDPEPYEKALQRFGLPASVCLAIEDSERGLAAALSAGVRCIVVPSDLTCGSAFIGAAEVIRDIGDLPAWLANVA